MTPSPSSGLSTSVSTPAHQIPDVTVRALVADVATETIAARLGDDLSIEYVAPGAMYCGPGVECVPLARELGEDLAGHLHRRPGLVAGIGKPAVSLAELAELIELRVARDLLDVSLARARHQAENLQIALESNRTIGIAIGITMVTRQCVATEALALLVRASQSQNRKLRDVAADVELTGVVPVATSIAS